MSQCWCSGARSWGSWLRSLSCLRAGVGLLVGGVEVQGVPGLVLAHWWVDLDPEVSGCLKLVSACWWVGLVLHHRLWGCGALRTGVHPLMGNIGAQWVLGLVTDHCAMVLVLRLVLAG